MEDETILTTVVSLVSSCFTGLVTFLFTRKKYNSEVKSNDIQNMQSTLQFYIDIVEDNKKRVDEYQKELESCRKEILELRTENAKLRTQLQEVTMQMFKEQKKIKRTKVVKK